MSSHDSPSGAAGASGSRGGGGARSDGAHGREAGKGSPAADRFARASDIFADCLELEPSLRAGFVAAATSGDSELRRVVADLLRTSELSGTFLDAGLPARQVREAAEAALREAERDGDRVAGYQIVDRLGSGGFGTVWLARQLQPVRREVALKVLKPGMDTREIVARFEQERQALARMSHENVARVLDAGVTESGRPFFAMELVRGLPITRHCDHERLGVRARLRLFVETCRGVQHAHQRGIVHRDLKPSNVLVTSQGGRPVPKVIDFGIAKAVEGDAEDRLLRTRHDEVLGTPAYMSPEQATPGAPVDTRTDVYSLGVLLYELLTGLLPFDRGALSRVSPVSGGSGAQDVEAQRPSDRLATHQALGEAACARGTEPSALRREIRGDLDWIVMTAMASEPDRRYPTVDALVADVERHLEHAPVQARPPSAVYRIGKFARKHRFGVVAAAVALVLLVAGLLGTSYGLAAATRARRVAEERSARAEEQAYRGSMLLAEQAIRSSRLDAARALLDDAPADLRGWEWSHLTGRLGRDVSIVLPPGHAVEALIVSRDGSRCWSWDRERLDTWDVSRGRIGDGVAIPGLGLTGWLWEAEDGAIVALNEAGRLVRVDASSGVEELPPIAPALFGACLDAKRRRIAWFDGSGTLAWRPLEGGASRRGPRLPGARDRNCTITRDGSWLVSTGFHDVTVIDAATLEIVHSTTWPESREISRFAVSPDRSLVAIGYSDGAVELRELGSHGLPLRSTLPSDPAWVSDLAFSGDGRRLAAGYGGGWVRTWEVASGQAQDLLALGGESVGRVVFHGERLLLAPASRGILSWGPGADEHRRLRGHASYVYAVAALDDGALAVSGGWDPRSGRGGGLKWWDVPSRTLVASWGDASAIVHAVTPSRDGARIFVACEGPHPEAGVKVFDARTGVVTASFDLRDRIVDDVAELDERTAVAVMGAGSGSETRLLDVTTSTSRLIESEIGADRALAVSRDGRWLALPWGRGGIQITDPRTLAPVSRRVAHDASAQSFSFSPDGSRIASASDDGTVAVWSVPSLQLLHRLRGSGSPVLCAAWSPDGARIAAGTRDGGIELWDPERALLVGRLTGHGSYVKSVSWTPDSRTLLSASGDHDVRVWDLMSSRDVAAAATEREALLARLDPLIEARFSASDDASGVARWIEEGASLPARERQVARQALLRRGLQRPVTMGAR